MLKIPVLAALASLLSLAACDGDGTGPGDLPVGRFEGEISGALDGRVNGEARSGSTTTGFHDLIVLTDLASGIELTILHVDDEFFEGNHSIGDGFEDEIVAYVEILETGEFFDSRNGTLNIYDADSRGIRGTVRFSAESADFPGDYISVDVDFNTDYDAGLDLNLSPRLNVSAKAATR